MKSFAIGSCSPVRYLIALSAFFALGGCKPSAAEEPGASGSATLSSAEAACPTGFDDKTLESGAHRGFEVAGEPRSFELLLPEGEAPEGGYPLVVAFHGTSETGIRFIKRAKLADFAARDMIVVAPNAAGHGTIWPVWDALRLPGDTSPNADLALFDRLVGCFSERFSVDRSRVFVIGHSAGGIMAHRVLRQRAEVVAGGVPASGLFELTGPSVARRADAPQRVIVTWGGDNDVYRGATPGGTRVQGFSFAEQGALASRYYARTRGVEQSHCRGKERGHAWLGGLNDWMIDTLLAAPGAEVAMPESAQATCSAEAAELPALGARPEAPSCESAEEPVCQSVCGQLSTCFVGNATLGPALGGVAASLGLSAQSCGRCLEGCRQMRRAAAGEDALLRCLAAGSEVALAEESTCDVGIEGALPLISRINTCCAQHPGAICRQLCSAVKPDDVSAAFFRVCAGD